MTETQEPILGLGEDYEPTKLWWCGVTTPPYLPRVEYGLLARYETLSEALQAQRTYIGAFGSSVTVEEPEQQTIQQCLDAARRYNCRAISVEDGHLKIKYTIPV